MLANSFEQTIFGEGFRQIFVGTHHSAACTVEQPILAGKHNDGSKLEAGIFFNKRAGLITIKSWHHDVNKNDIGLMIRNLGQRVKTVLSQNAFSKKISALRRMVLLSSITITLTPTRLFPSLTLASP
jgi:hypothetical protein